jgi:hypothetical protein
MTFLSRRRSARLFRTPRMAYVLFASPKSGTTWLQRLVSHHPDAVCAESRAFGDYHAANPSAAPHLTLQRYCGILAGYFAPTIPELSGSNPEFQRALIHNFLDALAATALQTTGKSVYGEKFTPFRGTAMQAVTELAAYNPRLKFVNLTRDGRDVIASGAAHWLNLRLRNAHPHEREKFEEALSCHTILREDFEMFLKYWTEATEVGLAARAQFANYLHVRYEDFVEDPCGRAARLFDFLGLKSGAKLVRECVEATSFDQLSGGRRRGEEDLNSFFRKGVVGDWKNWFTPQQQVAFEESAGHLLANLGYTRETPLDAAVGADC